MPSERFIESFKQLCTSIDLAPPALIEDVMSLQVGPQVCTLTEHPVDHLLMFIEITAHPEASMAEQNLHCQDLCKPVIGRDPRS